MKDKPFHDLLLKFVLLPSNSSPLLKRIILKNVLFFKTLQGYEAYTSLLEMVSPS